MNIIKLTDNISVAPQIQPDDMPAIAKAGFKSLICNRPNDEALGQPPYDSIANMAMECGIKPIYQPVIASQITKQNIDDFFHNITNEHGPILAYCRTGTRCAILWALAEARHTPLPDLVAIAAQAGYDLTHLL